MAQIKVRIAHAPEELQSQFFVFEFHTYAVPATVSEGGYLTHSRWGYLNANGYAQMFDPAKPPSRHPIPERAIIILDLINNSEEKTNALKKAGVF